MPMRRKLLSLLLILLSSCGYQLNEQRSIYATSLTIPYVENDFDGRVTDALIKAFSESGSFTYEPHDGILELKVKIINNDNRAIDWRYNRLPPEGRRNSDLINIEARRFIDVEVTLIDSLNDDVVLGPVVVQASYDFDFYAPDSIRDVSFINSAGVRQASEQFSLGQLDSVEGAFDDSWHPLSRIIAKKILDLILHASYY